VIRRTRPANRFLAHSAVRSGRRSIALRKARLPDRRCYYTQRWWREEPEVNIAGTDTDPRDRQRDAADHGNRNPCLPGAVEQVTERGGLIEALFTGMVARASA
jgi:hypothetical protein